MMRIGILALLQESNTFISEPTTLKHFSDELLVEGEQVRERLAGSHHEVAGMFAALEEEGADAVPLFAARAMPFGVIEPEAIETLLRRMFQSLDGVKKLDGILIAAHGATVSQPWPDVDGHWLTLLRERVGPELPIIGTLDPHANLSPAMVAACNALIAYRTNPHLDQRARGIDAGRMMINTVRGRIKPTMAAVYPPMAINIEKQHTNEEPCQTLYHLADAMLLDERLLTNSILLGFPYADVEEMGSAAIVVTDGAPALARELASQLGAAMWKNREAFVGDLIGIEQAIDQALASKGPVLLLDMGDNVGGGSPGDGTLLAHAMHGRAGAKSFVCLCDPQAVQHAERAGQGQRISLTMGGKTDDRHGPPLTAEVTVKTLTDGRFEEPLPRHGGFTQMDQGLTAVVEADSGLTVMLTTRRMPPFSLQQLLAAQVDPARFQMIVAKGVNAPIAAYAPVCPTMIKVNTPGCTTADMLQLTYHHRRRPMFPWEPETTWSPSHT
jgi:microcystin degradation protein MlrC